jgi:hypothetical protein
MEEGSDVCWERRRKVAVVVSLEAGRTGEEGASGAEVRERLT